jgi:NAD(P)-dependent dehydrogenase (short-subunit alcohol dehydrogenase family)/acyl carrier protein/3-hydroxymyristoyl/3-hydroxydecanoyl-(acyl carrier protein) dehydratase
MNKSSNNNQELVNLLSNYFSRRGEFLAKVIKADFKNYPLTPKLDHQSAVVNHALELDSPQIQLDLDTSNQESVQVSVMEQNVAAEERKHSEKLSVTKSIEKILLDLIIEQTGYPLESITLDAKLLDDLNLDSIKSAEVVAQAAKQISLEGQIDPSLFANATLSEVINALQQIQGPKALTSVTKSIEKILLDLIIEQTGYPLESITLDAKLLDDLNLDSIKSAEVVAQTAKKIDLEGQIDPSLFANATLSEVINALQQIRETKTFSSSTSVSQTLNITSQKILNPWVRNFVVEYIAEPVDSLVKSSNLLKPKLPVNDWTNKKVLIVANPHNKAWAKSLSKKLKYKAAQVKIVDFRKLSELPADNYTHIIAILPSDSEPNITAIDRLEKAMSQLRTVATFPVKRDLSKAAWSDRDQTSVSYIQFGDGYFGKEKQLGTIDTNCTVGFAASLHLERPDLKVRVIDLPSHNQSNLLFESVIAEIARPDAYLAVGFDDEMTRRIPRPCLQDRTSYQNRNISWSKADVVLVTGGAKGITAECTLAWAKQTGVSLALVGSSAHPQANPTGKSSAEITKTLNRFQAEDLTCNYYQCNVADQDALTNLVEVIQAEMGTVTGVIHGAAINRAKPVNNSTIEDAIAEVKPKIMGAINLAQIFQATSLKLFAGFSSIGAIVGLPGNTWYSFSNEALDLILRDYKQQHPDTAIISIAYSVWSEVGMGAKMGAVSGLAKMGIGAISRAEGIDRFVQLMEEDPGNAQVVIAARIDGRISLQHNFDTWLPPQVSPPKNLRFLEQILMNEPGVETIARTHLTLAKDSYVQDHIYKGSYLFPTVFGLEAMAQTVAYTLGIDSFSSLRLENVRLERPIVVHPENGTNIEIHAEVAERITESASLKVYVEIRTESTGFTKAHFAADFVLETAIKPTNYEIPQPLVALDIKPQEDLYGWLLFQGVKFQRIQEIYSLDSQKMVFLTEQKDFLSNNSEDRSFGPFLLGDPYYRDSLLHSVQPMVAKDLCLPLGIQSIEIYLTQETAQNYVGVALNDGKENDQYTTTVMAINHSGQVIEKLTGYQLKIMEHCADNPTAEELVNPEPRDQQLLYQELNQRAETLGIVPPQVTMAHLPGLHHLSLEERHKLEMPLFSQTVDKLMRNLK